MSLTNLSAQIRASIKWLLIAAAVLFLLWLSWAIISNVSKAFTKPKGDAIAFGNLPLPLFTKTFFTLKSNTFELGTPLTETKGDQSALVFKVEKQEKFSASSMDKVTKFFNLQSTKKTQSDNILTYETADKTTKLTFNTALNTIVLRRDYPKSSSVSSEKIYLSDKEIINKSEKILESMGLLQGNTEKSNASVKFLSIKNGKRAKSSKSSANAVEISYFRKVNKKVSMGDAPIRLVLYQNGDRILELDYSFLTINAVGSPYPIVETTAAWEEVKNQKAFVSNQQEYDSVKLKKIDMSYWESKFYQPFLQPIWVLTLEGKKGSKVEEVQAFLPAIDPSFFEME